MTSNDNNSLTAVGDESLISPSIGSRFVKYVMRFLLQLLRHLHLLPPLPREAEAEASNINIKHLADGTAEDLSADEVAVIFSFLSYNEIMHARVCETWRDAAKKTIEDEIDMHHADYDDDDETAATEDLSADEVAIIFSFLPHVVDIMCARRVCVTWREAAKKTIVPPSEFEFEVDSDISYNAMRVMSTALTNLQQISLHSLNAFHKYSDGEDPERWQARRTDNYVTHDIQIISNFRKLRSLRIEGAPLNGRFHVLFDFPLLQHLYVNCAFLKWDLNVLEGFPLLKELELIHTNTGISLLTGNLSSLRVLMELESVTLDDNPHVTGNLSSLRVLNGTLEKLFICNCRSITGNFMDLADFPRLTELDLIGTAVEGSILDIRQDDFSVLKTLSLPSTVQGGVGYKFQHIAEVPNFMQAIHLLLQRTPTPTLFEKDRLLRAFGWKLSVDSPDWYDSEWIWHRTSIRSKCPSPPFALQFIHVGPRLGWSWCDINVDAHSCEINWLDPAPSSESSDHEAYVEDLQRIEQRIDKDFYRGYHHPPNEEQYRRLCEEFFQEFRLLLI